MKCGTGTLEKDEDWVCRFEELPVSEIQILSLCEGPKGCSGQALGSQGESIKTRQGSFLTMKNVFKNYYSFTRCLFIFE